MVRLVRRASRTTRKRLALAFALVVLGGSCRDPASGTLSGESSSSGTDGVTSSDGTLTSSSGAVLPMPFVLPEGCGDGVAVSGQYDCHYPVSLEHLQEDMGARFEVADFEAWDVDGDGRDELVAQGSGFSPTPWLVAPFRWDRDRFAMGRLVGGLVGLDDWTAHFDIDRDGRQDLIKIDDSVIAYHLSTSSFELGDERVPALFDVATWGFTGPMDVDLDGQLEALTARDEPIYLSPELWLHRAVDGIWTPVGQALELPGCHWAARFAWADFNDDGYDDVAVLNHPSACDPFPVDYDPSWHSISIFFNEPLTHTLTPGPVIPAGDVTWDELLLLEDFDDDGLLDFLVGLGDPVTSMMTGAALVRGHGDGSFDEGFPIELPETPEWSLAGRGDLDGDGDLDWILRGDTVVDDIFAAEPEIIHVHIEAIGADGQPWTNTRAFGDFNGDGLVDYIGRRKHAATGASEMVAMISAP